MKRVFPPLAALHLMVAVGTAATARQADEGFSPANPIHVKDYDEAHAYIKKHLGRETVLRAPDRDEKRQVEIERIEYVTAAGKKGAVYFEIPFDTKDYLTKGPYPSQRGMGPADFEIKYDNTIRKILSRAWQRDVILRSIHFPPFDRESIVGIIRTSGGYRVFHLEPTAQIWAALSEPKTELPKIRPIYKERPVNDSVAKRIAAASESVLKDPRNYRKDNGIYTDTSSFTFSVRRDSNDELTASTLWVERGTKAMSLLELYDAVYKYVIGRTNEVDLGNSVVRAERELGVNKRR
jgi:hypothetical protein